MRTATPYVASTKLYNGRNIVIVRGAVEMDNVEQRHSNVSSGERASAFTALHVARRRASCMYSA